MKTPCSYYNDSICRSCTELQIPLTEQIRSKENALLNSITGLTRAQLLQTQIGAPYHFRNRAKMAVTGSVDHPVIGLTGDEDSRLDQGRELLDCPIHHPKINSVLHAIKPFITDAKIAPYQIDQRKGELKTLILYYSPRSNEMYLRFVLRTTEAIERIRKKLPALIESFPFITCVSANLQPIAHAILEGPEEVLLTGNTSIQHRLGNFTLQLSPRAFVQTNHEMAEKLYETAALWVKELKIKKMTELFCGQGAFSFYCMNSISEALGIEINTDAVETANQTAKKLGASHLHFKTAAAGDVENELLSFEPDLLLANPPRKGLGKALDFLKRSAIPYLIYSSCSHETLANDLEALNQYEIVRAQIFDLFPHTRHFETLVLLKLKKL